MTKFVLATVYYGTVTKKPWLNLIFDVVAPFGFRLDDEELAKEIFKNTKKKLGERYFTVIKVDKK